MSTNINFNKKLGLKGGTQITLPSSSTPEFSDVNSFLFDGVDEKMFSTANYTELNGSTNFSISFWIKPIGTNTNGVWEIETQGNNETLSCRYMGSQQLIIIHFRSQSYYYRSAPNSVLLNQWSHIVYTYNSALGRYDRPEIYVNGALSQGVNSGVPYTSSNFNGTLTFGDATQYVYGNNYINEFAVWNDTTLTQTQANELYNGGAPSDLNNIASGLSSPTTWLRLGENSVWNGFTWTMTDVNGGAVLRGVNMQESSRTTDVPTVSSFANTKSIALDGVDDYVQVADADNLSFGDGTTDSPFSISAWIKIGQTTAQGIVTKYGSNSSTREYLFYTTGGKLRLLFIDASNGANNFATGTTNLSIDTWYHVACTYDGRGGSTAYNGMTLYINGVAESVTTIGGSYTAMSNTTEVVQIGKYSTNELLGNIDEVSVFNSELSQSDITSIYNSGEPNDISSLSPLSWWRCGDGDTAPTLTDNGSGGNNGTMTNFSTFSTDVPPNPFANTKSILLDGVDDYVDCGNDSSLQITGELSLSAWVKVSTSTSGANAIIAKDNLGSRCFDLFAIGSAGTPRLLIWNSNSAYGVNATTDIKDNLWHHVVGVFSPSNSLKIYVDGVLEGTNSTSVPSSIDNDSVNVTIGGILSSSTIFFSYLGNIDEVSLFNTELSASDVTTIYNSGVPNDISSLSPVSWWRCGDGDTAPTLTDNGSGGNDGTMTNFSTFSTDVPTFSKKSIALDGVDDYVSFSQVTYTGEFTTSFWIKPDALGASFLAGREANSDYIWLRTTSQIRIRINFSTYTFSETGSNTINTGSWNHLLISRDSSNNLSLFLNGAIFSSSQVASGDHRLDQIGKVVTSYYDGNVDETAFWDSDQSSNLATIYNSGVPDDISSLSPTLWYRMGDGDTSPTLTDNGSGGNDGTMTNFTTFSTDVPT